MSGDIAGSAVQITGGFKAAPEATGGQSGLNAGDLWLDFSGELSDARPSQLANQLGLAEYGFTTLYSEPEGPLSLVVESAGELSKGYSTIITGKLPQTVFSAKGLVTAGTENKPSYDFEVTLGSENISPVVTWFGYLVPGLNDVLGDVAPMSMTGTVTAVESGGAAVKLEKGQIGGNRFAG